MINYDICIIGGGFFGLYLASYFSRNKVKVLSKGLFKAPQVSHIGNTHKTSTQAV